MFGRPIGYLKFSGKLKELSTNKLANNNFQTNSSNGQKNTTWYDKNKAVRENL